MRFTTILFQTIAAAAAVMASPVDPDPDAGRTCYCLSNGAITPKSTHICCDEAGGKWVDPACDKDSMNDKMREVFSNCCAKQGLVGSCTVGRK